MIDYKNILATLNLQIKSIFSGHPIAIAGLIGFVIFVLTALLAPWIAPQNPYDLMVLDIMDGLLPPLSKLANGDTAWLGTDALGRDILSAVMYGLRLSLFVAFVAVKPEARSLGAITA